MILDVASWACILLGLFFVVTGAFGLLRLPDVFTRIHAASVIDTVGVGFVFAGLALQAGLGLVALKLLILFALFLFTTPVTAHALAQASLHEKILPILAEDRRDRMDIEAPHAAERTPS
jgi:multicomponent Na+:H+ antiporter subunit G